MNSNQYSNNYGYNQPVGKHNLPPIAAISSAVNYRATARNPKPSDNPTAGYGGQTQQGTYNQGTYQTSNYPESSSSGYQYANTNYTPNSATSYPDQQTNNFNAFNQRPAEPLSNSQPSYLVPQTIKANAATYSDSRFAMFPEPNSQKHLDNYVKPSQTYGNYAPLPNFKDLTSSYSQQQYTPQSNKQPSSVPKSNDVAKMTGYSGSASNTMQTSDWMNKSDYQNLQMKSGKTKLTEMNTKKLPSMGTPTPANTNAQPSFQQMEAKAPYPGSAGHNYGYPQGQARTSNGSSHPYQMFNTPGQGDVSTRRDHDGFKVPQQMQALPEFNMKPSNPYQTSTGQQYLPEPAKESSKSFQQQNPLPNESNKGANPSPRYPYAEHKRTDSLPNLAQYDYKMTDNMQPATNPSMKQAYSMNNLNTDNRYPVSQLNSTAPLDNRLNSYGSTESVNSSYMNNDPRYKHPGAVHTSKPNYQSFQNMDYNYKNVGQFQGQTGKATLEPRPTNDLKTSSAEHQMKTSYPSSSFISDKFNSMAAGSPFQAQNDPKGIQQHTGGQNPYNFQAQQYPASNTLETADSNSRAYYSQQQNDRAKLQSPAGAYSPHSSGGSPRSSVLTSPLNNYTTSASYKVPPSPKAPLTPQTSISSSPKGSISSSPHSTVPLSPYSSIPSSPVHPVLGQGHYSAPSPATASSFHNSVPPSPHQIPPSPSQHYSLAPSPSQHNTSIPPSPSPHLSSIPHSPSPHQIPSSPSPHHGLAPSPSPLHNSIPASPHHSSIPPSPSQHHTSIPPSPSQYHSSVPPSPSQHHSIPPSPSQHHPVPPSPSPHHSSIPASPLHSSIPPSPHPSTPSPSLLQTGSSLPPALSQQNDPPANISQQSSVPCSPHPITSLPTDVPTSPQQIIPTSPSSSLPAPSCVAPAAQPAQSTIPLESSTSPTPHSTNEPCVMETSVDNVEKGSTDLETGHQPSPPELSTAPVPESKDVPESSEKTKSPLNDSLEISTSMDLEQCVKSPSGEFQSLLSLRKTDSVSPRLLSTMNQNSSVSDDDAQNKPERLKTPELKNIENPKPVAEDSDEMVTGDHISGSNESRKDTDIQNVNATSQSDISNKDDQSVKNCAEGNPCLSKEIDSESSVSFEPCNENVSSVDKMEEDDSSSKNIDALKSVENVNTSVILNESERIDTNVFDSTESTHDGSSTARNEDCQSDKDKSSPGEQKDISKSGTTPEPKYYSSTEYENNTSEKEKAIPAVTKLSISEEQNNESMKKSSSQDKENHTENVPTTNISEEVRNVVNTIIEIPNAIICSEKKATEFTLDPENGEKILEKHDDSSGNEGKKEDTSEKVIGDVTSVESSKNEASVEASKDEKPMDVSNGFTETVPQQNNIVEENSKFYKANMIQSNINRLKENRNKSVIENVSNLSKETMDDQPPQNLINKVDLGDETPLETSHTSSEENEPKARNILGSKNKFLDIHHSDTTKILEHVAATLANHKRQINNDSEINEPAEYIEKPIPKDVSEDDEVVRTEAKPDEAASYKKQKEAVSLRREEPQNLCVESFVNKKPPSNGNTNVVNEPQEQLKKTSTDKVAGMEAASSKTRSPHYYTPKDRILNYEHQMSMQASNKSKEVAEQSLNLGKPSDGLRVDQFVNNRPSVESSRTKQDEPHARQTPSEPSAKPLFNYETYLKQRQILQASMESKLDKSNEHYDKKIKSTTVMPEVAHVPPPAHSMREDLYRNPTKNISLPQASLNFQKKDLVQRKDLVLSQVQAAEKYSDIQLQQHYEQQQQQKYSEYERYIMKQSTESAKARHPATVPPRKESKPVKKQSRVSDKGLDSTSPRLSLQDQQKEYMKLLQKQQYHQYDPSHSQMSDQHKSQKQQLDKRQYEDQYKLQNYVQHLAQEEAIREKQRKQLNEQRLALQNFQERQKYELEQLQQKQQAQLQNQQRSQQELQYSARGIPQPSFQSKPPGTPMSSSSSRDRQKQSLPSQNPYPYNFMKQENKSESLPQYPGQFDLTEHIKTQNFQHHQTAYPSSADQNKSSRDMSMMLQYQQSQQQLSDNMRRQQQAQQRSEPPRSAPGPAPSRVSSEKQKSQPVKKRQYTPVAQAPPPPPAAAPAPPPKTQVSAVSSTARGTIASPLDLSVKTVRQSADSTAKDEEGHRGAVSSSVPKLDISPNFTNQQLMSSMFSAYNALPSAQGSPHPTQPVPPKKQKKSMTPSQRGGQSPYDAAPRGSQPPYDARPAQPSYDTMAPSRASHPPYDSPGSSRASHPPYDTSVSSRPGQPQYDPLASPRGSQPILQQRYPEQSFGPGSMHSMGSPGGNLHNMASPGRNVLSLASPGSSSIHSMASPGSNVHSLASPGRSVHSMGSSSMLSPISNIHNMMSPSGSNRHPMAPSPANNYNPYTGYSQQPSSKNPAKRPPADLASISPVPSKYAKVENWRQTIELQIDQKLAKAQQQLQQNQASEKLFPPAPSGPKLPQQYGDLSHPSQSLPSPSMPGQSLPSPGYPQQRAPSYQPADVHKSLHVVTSLPSSQPPSHASPPSFLQSQQMLLQKQQAFNQQSLQQYHEQQRQGLQYPRTSLEAPPLDKRPSGPPESEPSFGSFPPTPRQNLPPFNAISFDKSNFMSRSKSDSSETKPMEVNSLLLGPKLTSYDHMFHGMPTVDNIKSAELDNVLAARIRTKAELKQAEPKTQPPGASPNDKIPPKAASPSRADLPPKLSKENQQTIPLRKSRTEEETRALARGMGIRSSSETSIFDFRDSESDEDPVKPSAAPPSLHAMRKDRKPRASSPGKKKTSRQGDNAPRSPALGKGKDKKQTRPGETAGPHSPSPARTPSPEPDLPLHIVDHENVYEDDAEPVEESMWDNMFTDFVCYLEKKPKNIFKKARKKIEKQRTPPKQKRPGYEYVPIVVDDSLTPMQLKALETLAKREEEEKNAAAVKEEVESSDSEVERRVPKLSLKINRPVIRDTSSDEEEESERKPRPRPRVKREMPLRVLSSSSASVSEIEESSSDSEEEDEEEEEEQPIITKQLRSRCVGKESQKPEPKMSLRSRNPVVKLTRLEDETKLSYEVKNEEPAVVKPEEKRSKRNLAPVEYVKNKRKKPESKPSTAESTPKKIKTEDTKVKSEEKVETPKSNRVEVTPIPEQSEESATKRSSRQSERTKKQKAAAEAEVKRPGWEEELYAFKRSLRMPAALIQITRPPGWPKPRPSASLPDLDSRSASPLTCDSFDMTEEQKVEEGNHKTSFLNKLAQRYGAGATKKGKGKKKPGEDARCRIIPQGGHVPRLLTPRVEDAPAPGNRRTRTELRRDTIRRVFGDDRPASAPPVVTPPSPQQPPSKEQAKKKKKEHVKIKKKLSPVSRTGLRSATKLRSNKVLLQRIQKKRRSSQSNTNKALNLGQNCPQNKLGQGQSLGPQEGEAILPRKHIKIRTMRRKFRSSGFDYIRKKKKKEKHIKRRHLGEDLHKKIRMTTQSLGDTVEDVGVEIRTWVINKHHGETPLHRAARLGYIDAVAYCLEKTPHGPAPKDNAGYTPLHEAASHGWLDIARLLLMYGADPSDSAIGGIRPLHDAAEKGCVEMVRLLLSYGADPLLASYAGHTPLSITSDETTRRLLEYHLADVRGHQAPSWNFGGPASCFDNPAVGYEPLAKLHTKHLESPAPLSDICIEASDAPLPPLYVIRTEPQSDRWALFSDIQAQLKPPRTKESLAKTLGQQAPALYREMKACEFQEMVQCTSLGGQAVPAPAKPGVKVNKITLVKYTDELKKILRVETVTIPTVTAM